MRSAATLVALGLLAAAAEDGHHMTCGELKAVYQQASLKAGGNGCCGNSDKSLDLPECNAVAPAFSNNIPETAMPDASRIASLPKSNTLAAVFARENAATSAYSYPAWALNYLRVCYYAAVDIATGEARSTSGNKDSTGVSKYELDPHTSKVNIRMLGESGRSIMGVFNVVLTDSLWLVNKTIDVDGNIVVTPGIDTWAVKAVSDIGDSGVYWNEQYQNWELVGGAEFIMVDAFEHNTRKTDISRSTYIQTTRKTMKLTQEAVDPFPNIALGDYVDFGMGLWGDVQFGPNNYIMMQTLCGWLSPSHVTGAYKAFFNPWQEWPTPTLKVGLEYLHKHLAFDESTSATQGFPITLNKFDQVNKIMNTDTYAFYNNNWNAAAYPDMPTTYAGMAWTFDARPDYVSFESDTYASAKAASEQVRAHMNAALDSGFAAGDGSTGDLLSKILPVLSKTNAATGDKNGITLMVEGDIAAMGGIMHAAHLDPVIRMFLVDHASGRLTGEIYSYHDHANQLDGSRSMISAIVKYKVSSNADQSEITLRTLGVHNDYEFFYSKSAGIWPDAGVTFKDVVGSRGTYSLPHKADGSLLPSLDVGTGVYDKLVFVRQASGAYQLNFTKMDVDAIQDGGLLGRGVSSFARFGRVPSDVGGPYVFNLKYRTMEFPQIKVADAWRHGQFDSTKPVTATPFNTALLDAELPLVISSLDDDGFNPDDAKTPGMQIYIRRGEAVYSKAFGRSATAPKYSAATDKSKVSMHTSTALTVFSMTKSIMNMLLLIFNYKNIVDMETPVEQWDASLAAFGEFRKLKEATETSVSGKEATSIQTLQMNLQPLPGNNTHPITFSFTINNAQGTDSVSVTYPMASMKALETAIQSQLQNSGVLLSVHGGSDKRIYFTSGDANFQSLSVASASHSVDFKTYSNPVLEPLKRKLYALDLAGSVGINPQAGVPKDARATQQDIDGAGMRITHAYAHKLPGTSQISVIGGDITNAQYLERTLKTRIASTHPGEYSYGNDHAILGAVLEFMYTKTQGNNPATGQPWSLEEIVTKELFDKVGTEDTPRFHFVEGDPRRKTDADGKVYVDYSDLAEVFTAFPSNHPLMPHVNESKYSWGWTNFYGQSFFPIHNYYSNANKFQNGAAGLAISMRDYGRVMEVAMRGGVTAQGERLMHLTDLKYAVVSSSEDASPGGGWADPSLYHENDPYHGMRPNSLWGWSVSGAGQMRHEHASTGRTSIANSMFMCSAMDTSLTFGWGGAAKTVYCVNPSTETLVVVGFQALDLSFNAEPHTRSFFGGKNSIYSRVVRTITNAMM